MDLFKTKQSIVFMIVFIAVLVVLLIFIGELSGFGFLIAEYLAKNPKLNYVCAVILALLGFLNCYRHLYRLKNLTTELAIRVYLSSGLGMSGIYYLVYRSHSGCYSLPSDIEGSASILDFIYFSFVTVTTVGYGDIIPRHTFVRVLVLFQVLFAVFLIIRATRAPK